MSDALALEIVPQHQLGLLQRNPSRISYPKKIEADSGRLAATIFQLFVASDTASETLAALKRIHGLMPYFVLKGVLRISNPMAMIRGQFRTIAIYRVEICRPGLKLTIQVFWISSSRDLSADNLLFSGKFILTLI